MKKLVVCALFGLMSLSVQASPGMFEINLPTNTLNTKNCLGNKGCIQRVKAKQLKPAADFTNLHMVYKLSCVVLGATYKNTIPEVKTVIDNITNEHCDIDQSFNTASKASMDKFSTHLNKVVGALNLGIVSEEIKTGSEELTELSETYQELMNAINVHSKIYIDDINPEDCPMHHHHMLEKK